MIYTVYVLFSKDHQKIYIGYTSNLLQRFKSHQALGKDWTARYRPWHVIYCEYFTDKSEVKNRETLLKQYKKNNMQSKHVIQKIGNYRYKPYLHILQ